jgi:hypothetical protein
VEGSLEENKKKAGKENRKNKKNQETVKFISL